MTTREIRLSIGIPTFNQAAYLEQTLESVLNQTEPAYEVVVSDNHCTDATPEILERFEGSIRVVRPPRHLPMGENWNFLLSELQGSWFSLLSSDDLALPSYVETLSRVARRSERAVLVRGGYRVIDEAGRPVKDKRFRRNPPRVSYPENLRAQLRGPSTSFAAFAADTGIAREVGGFPNHQMTADWGLWLRLAPKGDFLSTSDIFSEYRQGHHSLDTEKSRLPLWIHDETEIYASLLPTVISRHGGIRSGELHAASRARCRSRIALASQLFAPDDRTSITTALTPWATSVGLTAELEALGRGEPISRKPRGPLRSALRGLGRNVRTTLGLRRRTHPEHDAF